MGLIKRIRSRLRARLAARFAPKDVQVIGLCRFSYPALGGFKVEHDDPAARAAYLYAPERLDERFRQFQAFTLPSLRAQTNADFTFVIVIGQDFPQRDRLETLVTDLPQVQIQAHPPGRHRDVMRAAINAVRQPGAWSMQFRLDDDDAIAGSFVAKLRRAFAQHYPLFAASRHVSLSFSRGFHARGGRDGLLVERAQALFPAVGQAIGFRPDVDLTVMNFAHHEVWQHMPTITRTDPGMWLRGVNEHNDSGDAIGRNLARPDPRTLKRIEADFGISDPAVRALWAAP